MKKLPFAVVCALGAAAIGLSSWSLIRSYLPEKLPAEYTMYVGTNDKATYQLEMTRQEARDIVHNRMMDHFPNGFTLYEADGVWRDDQNVVTLEYTLVCIVETEKRDEVYKVADELLVALNQNTILIVANAIHSVDFYTGH